MRWWTAFLIGALCVFPAATSGHAKTSPAASRPVAVTVSPQRCLVTEAVPVPAAGTVQFLLPLAAEPEALALAAPAARLASLSWKRVPLTDAEQVAALRKELDTVRLARNTVAAQLKALKTQGQFLKTMPGFRPDQAKEVIEAAESMGRRLAELGMQQLPLQEEKQRLDREVARLEEQLGQLTGDARQAWEVTARFDAGNAGRAFQANATYPLADCGWEPSYRLDARPAAKTVAFAYDARVWQRTGADWTDVRLTLATALPLSGLTPPDIPPWIIQQRPEPRPMAKAMRMEAPGGAGMAMDAMNTAPAEMLAAAPAPMQEERATYTAWDMGVRTIPAGEAPRLEVVAETWPAAFRYTIRPSQGPTAWLTANATLPTVQDLPPGEALFLVDGALAGRRHFALAGNQTDLFFGEAPFIKTTTELVARESGETGFISSKQTHRWNWKFTVQNLGKAVAPVRVEEPNPQRRDERMELKIASTPQTSRTDEQILYWEKDLKPGEKFVINHDITLTAPGDMKLDAGWR
ncbi:DUF4139 domain-containing protein [Megalodesulfovibrio gigas]|nr:DUF4139 domain-containing protein [Megalodesulfovibrio gigas]